MRAFCGTGFYAWCVLLALLCGCGPSQIPSTQPEPEKVAPAAQQAQPREILDERWEAIFLKGAKVGHGHTVRERIKVEGETRIRTTSVQLLSLQRFEQTTIQAIEVVSEETEEGRPLKLRCELSGATSLQTSGEFRDGTLELVTTTQGKRTTEVMDCDAETLGYFGLEDSLRRQPMKPGDKRSVKWLQPVVNKVTDDELEATAEELVAMPDGQRKMLLRISSSAKLAGRTIESTLWTDEKGVLWRTSQPPGQDVYRTTEEIAKAESGKTVDLGLSTIVKVARSLESPHDTRRVVYRATLKKRDPAKVFPSCGSQTVKGLDEHTAEIAVRRVTETEPEKFEAPAPAPSAGDSAANNFIQSDDENVVRMARELAKEEDDPVKAALALERGVHARVKEKNFSQAFATAADVAKHLEGDCTEHAVLLAALLRTRQIPARVAAGLVYYPPEQGFAYHMWTEAWLDDRWVPLDATLGRGGIGGAHLKVFDSNLEGSGAIVDFLAILDVMDQLELEIVEAQ